MPETGTQYRVFDTAIGACAIAWSERGLIRLLLPDSDAAKTERRIRTYAAEKSDALPPHVKQAIGELQRYFAGEKCDFSGIALDLETVDEFRRGLYSELRKVRWGQTVTYGELAKRMGLGSDARPVGEAMGKNPIPVIVPCHRVVATGNKIGGFSAPGGAATKERLLALEGVQVGEPRLPGF